MKNKLFTCLAILLPHFLIGQSSLDMYYGYQIGEWRKVSLFDAVTVYRADSTVDVYHFGDAARMKTGFQINIDTLTPWRIGEMRFRINLHGDTLMNCQVNTTNNNEEFCSRILLLTDTLKVSISYKKGRGIDGHIDGVGFSYKHKIPQSDPLYHCPEEDIGNRFILKEDFTGLVAVVYQLPNMVTTFDKSKQRTFHIPNNGLLETTLPVDPISFAMRQNAFYYPDESGNPVKRLPLILNGLFSSQVLQLEKTKHYLSHFNPDEVYVVPYGYNEKARYMLNEYFGKELIGNVEMYRVGRLKDLINE